MIRSKLRARTCEDRSFRISPSWSEIFVFLLRIENTSASILYSFTPSFHSSLEKAGLLQDRMACASRRNIGVRRASCTRMPIPRMHDLARALTGMPWSETAFSKRGMKARREGIKMLAEVFNPK